ncbi:hypothetical protein IFM51744_10456 [Aspergillus udagawae]|nr:hypothetical protein IFM51744_10456 [Aspergillus udagawae]
MIVVSIDCNSLHCRFTKVDEKANHPVHRLATNPSPRLLQRKRSAISDFSVQGRPIKRKRESSCNRAGPGNRDVGEMRKDADSHNQQSPKSTVSPTNSEPPAKEKVPAVSPTAAAVSSVEPFQPLIRELQRLDDQNPADNAKESTPEKGSQVAGNAAHSMHAMGTQAPRIS